jgi:hypothetical protein
MGETSTFSRIHELSVRRPRRGRDLEEADWRLAHLKAFFAGWHLLAVLGRMLRLARASGAMISGGPGPPRVGMGGMAGRLRHDFRRTAVRNMVNVGVPERVAMTVTAHMTRAVFDRYHIVRPADLQDVARRPAGTIAGIVEGAAVDAGPVSV